MPTTRREAPAVRRRAGERKRQRAMVWFRLSGDACVVTQRRGRHDRFDQSSRDVVDQAGDDDRAGHVGRPGQQRNIGADGSARVGDRLRLELIFGDAEIARQEVGKLLEKLPARERKVVRLFYIEGRGYEEIATELNSPVNSIGPILSRAKKKMRQDTKSPPPLVRPQPQPEED